MLSLGLIQLIQKQMYQKSYQVRNEDRQTVTFDKLIVYYYVDLESNKCGTISFTTSSQAAELRKVIEKCRTRMCVTAPPQLMLNKWSPPDVLPSTFSFSNFTFGSKPK